MKFRWKQLLLCVLVLSLTVLRTAVPSAQAPQPASDIVANEWIVTMVADADPNVEAPELARSHGGQAGHIYENVLHGFSFHGSPQAAAALSRNPRIASVIPNRVVRAVAETLPTGVRRIDASHPTAVDAHDLGFTGAGITVAILDTGIQSNHEDLVGKVVPSLGKNCMNPTLEPADGNGHGTHVAGTVAAISGNSIGVIGVAPSASLAAVKVLDDNGSGTLASAICGVDWVTAHATDIKVANMSLSGDGSDVGCNDGGLHKALCDSVAAGVVYVVAAGNSSNNASNSVPAAYPEVITVSALNDSDGEPGADSLASFSNFGSIVDVIGPGVNILSTYNGNRYATGSGTSMASPHVAGVAALVRSANPALTPAQVEDLLKSSGECPNTSQNTGGGTCAGQGQWSGDPDGIPEPLINALAAAEAAATGNSNTPPVANNDSYSVANGGTLTVSAPGVLANDSDVNGNSIIAVLVSGPANGSLALDAAGSFTYTHNGGSSTSDSFTYKVNDGTVDGNTATVSLAIAPVPTPATTMYVQDLAASSVNNGSTWTAVVTVKVLDNLGQPVSGAGVSGHWSAGASGNATCDTLTDSNGFCSVRRSSIEKKTASVTFNVDNLTKSPLTYNSSANLKSSVVVKK
jgi:subtilisin